MAAEQGHGIAQFVLFHVYFDGNEGVPRDYTEAAKWLHLLVAEQDPAEVQLGVGKLYEEGEDQLGIQKDYVKAYAWYILSTAQGIEEASKLKDSLREELTAEQIAEAQQLAAEFRGHIEAAKPE